MSAPSDEREADVRALADVIFAETMAAVGAAKRDPAILVVVSSIALRAARTELALKAALERLETVEQVLYDRGPGAARVERRGP
jgi:phosphohistidine phosphatase SixA